MANTDLANVDLNVMIALDALLAEANVTRAATRLRVTQSAMSHSLNRLRALFDDPLLVRQGAVMVRTPLAEQLAPRVQAALREVESVLRHTARFDPAATRRRFVILASDYAVLLLLPPLMRTLAERAPGIDVVIRSSRSPERELGQGAADLVIGPERKDAPNLRRQRLFGDRLVCLARRGHARMRAPFTLDDYLACDHALVSPRESPGGIIDDALLALGLERRVSLVLPHFVVAPLVVARTDLVLTIPERMARVFAEHFEVAITLLPIADIAPLTFVQYWHERHHHDPAHAFLRGEIAAVAHALDVTSS